MKKLFLSLLIVPVMFIWSTLITEAGYVHDGTEYEYFVQTSNGSRTISVYLNLPDGWHAFLCGTSSSEVYEYQDCEFIMVTDGETVRWHYDTDTINGVHNCYFLDTDMPNYTCCQSQFIYHDKYDFYFVSNNLPIFESHTAAMNYFKNGDTTGSYFIPDSPVPPFNPVTDAHDFTKDVYDPDLPVPVLSNVSYTGFSIENPDSKEWQVVVDGRVYGLKWNPSYTDPMILTNFNYTVNHQIWNFADHPDKLSLNGRFDVYDTFGISTYDWFVAQVKQYANDVHPSDYPNYSFLKVGMKTGWNTFLDYIKDIGSDEAEDPSGAGHRFEQNIYRSRMCQVTYYVRFVEYDSDDSPHYSRWMAYTLKPSQDVLVEGENFSRGNVEFGEVTDVDTVTGRPVVSEKENLKYNTDTGEYEYYEPLSNQGFQFEMNDVFGYLSGLKESVMGFADLIAYCFSFLPSWVSQFISYSLVVAISFSVIRLIRG